MAPLNSHVPDALPPARAAIWRGVYAALDLGTHNCRMLIAVPQVGPDSAAVAGGFRVIESFSRIVRLGEGLHEAGRLGEPAMLRARAALEACAARLARYPIRGLRAVATEACRQAPNGPAFLADMRAATGLPLELISPREEAGLAVESCASLIAGDGRRMLLFDIGGGSTELAWLRLAAAGPPELIGYLSLPVGVVTLADRYRDSMATEAGFAAIVADLAARFATFEQVHCIGHEIRQGGVRLLGTSGTITTLAAVALGLPRYRRQDVDGARLTGAAADAALAALCTLGPEGLLAHPCIGPERAEYVLPGCAIFSAIRRLWPAPEVIVADRGLREGMLARLIRAGQARPRPLGRGSAP